MWAKPETVITLGSHSEVPAPAEGLANELAQKGVEIEVIALRTLKLLDIETILASVKRTGWVPVAYEGYETGGVGAEIAALIAENVIDYLDGPIIRVAPNPIISNCWKP